LCYSAETRRQADIHNRDGGTAEAAFDAVDGTIDSMTTTLIISHYEPNPDGEMANEQ